MSKLRTGSSHSFLQSHGRSDASAFRLALIANLLWGTSFLASKATLAAWGPFVATQIRFGLALLLMAITFPALGLSVSKPRGVTAWAVVIGVGLTGFGLLYPLQMAGMRGISSASSSAIMLTSPLIVLISASIFLGEKLSSQKLLAIGLGILGGTLLLSDHFQIVSDHHSRPSGSMGTLLTFGAAGALAASVIITRRSHGVLSPQTLTFWSMLIGSVLLLPFTVDELRNVTTRHSTGNTALAWGSVVYLAAVCSALCFLLWNRAIAAAPAKDLASSMHVKTPVAILLGASLGQEIVSVKLIAGATIVAAGVWLSHTDLRSVRKTAERPHG